MGSFGGLEGIEMAWWWSVKVYIGSEWKRPESDVLLQGIEGERAYR